MDPLHQDRNKQLPQAPMPGGFEATSQPGYNPALNPAMDPMHQQGEHQNGGLLHHQGEHQNGGLRNQGEHQNGSLLHHQGEHQNGGLRHQGERQNDGLLHHQGEHQNGGLHHQGEHQHGGLRQGEHQNGGLLHQGEHQNGGLYKGEHQNGGLHQGGLDQGGLHQGGLDQGGLHQGGLHQGGLHQGGLHQGGLHQGGLHQDNLHQNDVNRGVHANNPRNTDIGLSHDQQIGAHHHDGMQAHQAHHTHQGAAVLPSANYGNDDDLSNPSSTTATHGSVDSRKDFETPSTTKGIKDTLAGNLQKIAGALTGNDQRRAKGETKAQEGKIQVNAAKTQLTGKHIGTVAQPSGKNVGTVEGHGRGDLQGTHLHDNKELERSAEVGGNVPPVGHGRGGLGNKEVGNDSVFANANTGKAAGIGYGRGGLEGMASREE